MAVAAAVLIGILIGLSVRPVLDAYLRFKTAELYENDANARAEPDGVRFER